MKKSLSISLAVIVVSFFGMFFLYPIWVMLAGAFRADQGSAWSYWIEFWKNPIYREGLWNALALGGVSTLLAFLLAMPLAWVAEKYRYPWKKTLSALLLLPLILPPFVGAVGIKKILGGSGALNALAVKLGIMEPLHVVDWLAEGRFLGICLMNALHLFPILTLNLQASLAQLDPSLEQAAENLGCPPWKRFWRISLPLLMPGLFAGASIVFVWSFTDLGVPLVFDYPRVTPVQIFDGLKDLESNPMPYVMVMVLLGISLILFGVSQWSLGKRAGVSSPRPKFRREKRVLLGWRGLLLSGGIGLIVLLASVPHVGVILLSVSGDWYQTVLPEPLTLAHFSEALGHELVLPSIRNSLGYSSLAMLLALVLGTVWAWLLVRSEAPGKSLLDGMSMLPLAVPGIILAFGYYILSQEGASLHWLMGAEGNPIFLLVLAYGIRRVPYVVRAAVAGFQQSNPAMEEAARSLGASAVTTWRKITLPLMGRHLAAGAILAFAFSMLEVSDSLILAQEQAHYPITKAMYSLLSTLGNGIELAAALGVWAMLFLGLSLLLAKSFGRADS